MIAAYGLGYLAGMNDQRRANIILSHSHYDKTAPRDFAHYARMSASDLLAELNVRQNKPGQNVYVETRIVEITRNKPGRKSYIKERVLEMARNNPDMAQREIARRCECNSNYVNKVMRGRR